MKTEESASTSGTGKGNKILRILVLLLILPVAISLYGEQESGWNTGYTIGETYFKFNKDIEPVSRSRYHLLLTFQKGDTYEYKKIRESISNLYKTGAFDNIETSAEEKPGHILDIYFTITKRWTIHSIKIKEVNKHKQFQSIFLAGLKKRDLLNSLYSIREQNDFDESKMPQALEEAKSFMKSKGYFAADITYSISYNSSRSTVSIILNVAPGSRAMIKKINLVFKGERKDLVPEIRRIYDGVFYIPLVFSQKTEKVTQLLVKDKYFLPEITVTEHFIDEAYSGVDLDITVEPGYRYNLEFRGLKNSPAMVTDIWKKRVFEKWAEKESKARLLYILKNEGYLDAKVRTKVIDDDKKLEKTIIFYVQKNKKYTLGDIRIRGNKIFPESKLFGIMQSDDIFYDRHIKARIRTLFVDREILRILYYFAGYPSMKIFTKLEYKNNKANVLFTIREGKKMTIDAILFDGNTFFTDEKLRSMMTNKPQGPFVQQRLAEDIEKIKNLYIANGFEKVEISPDITPDTEKVILIKIKEGKSYRMGDLITIDASSQQRKLVEHLFPFKKGEPFSEAKLEDFQREIENSFIFNRFKLVKLEKNPGVYDVMIRLGADYSTFYGFGIGWEGWKNIRGTLEYQGRNIFRSYSNFSALLQLGPKEQSGVLSYDTPYFFKTRINSSLKIWDDNEIYPSYKFIRYGIGESLIKKINPNSYVMASLSWYRTKITELEITENKLDRVGVPFNTTAFDLSYVNELRDDPFSPTKGTFFSTDLKVGLPVMNEKMSFVRFRCNFQKNFKVLKTGIFSASIRTGLAYGDLSITERFFAGGFNSFRASTKDRLGPIDPLTGNPKGGNALLLLNFESSFPIPVFPVEEFYYTVFFDVGNVFEKAKNFDLTNLRKGLGLSLKYKTKMGPVRLDLGWDLKTGKSAVQIGIGNVF